MEKLVGVDYSKMCDRCHRYIQIYNKKYPNLCDLCSPHGEEFYKLNKDKAIGMYFRGEK